VELHKLVLEENHKNPAELELEVIHKNLVEVGCMMLEQQ
jgi:hypothetical protein